MKGESHVRNAQAERLDEARGDGDSQGGIFQAREGKIRAGLPPDPRKLRFTIIAKVKPGREQAVRDYANTIENAVKGDPTVLASLKLHYLRWVLFDVGSGLHFM